MGLSEVNSTSQTTASLIVLQKDRINRQKDWTPNRKRYVNAFLRQRIAMQSHPRCCHDHRIPTSP